MPVTTSANKKLKIPGGGVLDKRLDDITAVKQSLLDIDSLLLFSITANFPGNISPIVGTSRNYPNKDISIKAVTAWLSENAASNVVVDIKKNSIVVQSITIPSGQLKVSITPSSAINLTSTDYLTVDIVSGSGKDLVVRMDY